MEFTEFDIKALLDSAPDAMVIADASGAIVFVNSQTEALFCHRRDDLIGRPIEILLPERFRDSHRIYRSRFFDRPKTRPMGAGLELFGRRADGSEFPIEISLSPVHTAAGPLVSSAIRDVTEHKKIERALTAARDEAERANRAKSAFLAAASHDLRQPLQTLHLLNAVLSKTARDEQAARAVERQGRSLEAMTDLLNSLLDISKLESGAIKPDVTECDIKAIFHRLRAEFELQAEAKGLKLLVDDCEDVVRTDPGLLERIIQNLVANAIRYTRQGLVQLRCLHLNGNVRIEVLDTGVGIPVDELDKIFDEFYQLERDAGSRREGLGLGLSIVQRLAKLLHHPLQVESTPGQGTCFAVTVPQGKETGPRRRASSSGGQKSARPAKVLIIDDDPAVADATTMLLQIEGHEVMLAATLDQALLRVTERGSPDVVVSDYHLRDATGLECIERLRAQAGRVIPAIIVTGDTSSLVPDQVDAVRACHVLNKPVDADALMALIVGLADDEPDTVADGEGHRPETATRRGEPRPGH